MINSISAKDFKYNLYAGVYMIFESLELGIFCFGDSNTYGYRPDGSGRFDADTRWTGLLQKKLGTNDRIIEEGLWKNYRLFR